MREKQVPKEENATRIIEYLKHHESATDEEVAAALNLHIIDVLDAVIELEKKGIVKSIDI